MNDFFISIILTTKCNLKCLYCVNDSGSALIPNNSLINEWESEKDIIDCLINISKARNIDVIKFYGGEPLLKSEMIIKILDAKCEFSRNNNVKFALTTNAYDKIEEKLLKKFMEHNVILNISLDGPEMLHNAYRKTNDDGNCYRGVMYNLEQLKKSNFAFSLVSVLDKRVIDYNYTLVDLALFLSKYTPVYKIDPVYEINKTTIRQNIIENLLKMQRDLIRIIFESILSLEEDKYIYENNILLTINSIVHKNKKEYVCSASDMLAIFPNKNTFSCHNLMNENFLISNDISKESPMSINNILNEKKELLRMDNFSSKYKEIELYGSDYCPLENNFTSFAYQYRKHMIINVSDNLLKITQGSAEHLSLLNYINKGFLNPFQKNIKSL